MITNCIGCRDAQMRYRDAQMRYRGVSPHLHCLRYRKPALARCLDYTNKKSAIKSALHFFNINAR